MSGTLATNNDQAIFCISGDCKATVSEGVSGTIPASSGGFEPGPVVCMGDAAANASVDSDLAGTLKSNNDRNQPIVAFAANQRSEVRLQGGDGEVTGAIPACQSGKQVGAIMLRADATPKVDDDLCQTLRRGGDGGTHDFVLPANGSVVRRLTPGECERLQGFPPGWTRIPWRGKPPKDCPDGPRYKAVGNSMCVNVMRWLGRRIEEVSSW